MANSQRTGTASSQKAHKIQTAGSSRICGLLHDLTAKRLQRIFQWFPVFQILCQLCPRRRSSLFGVLKKTPFLRGFYFSKTEITVI